MADDTARTAVAVDTWTSLVKAALGALGLGLLAVGPLIRPDESFPYLPHYAFAIGGVLVLVSATMRLRSMLIVLGCLALTAGLTCTLVGGGEPRLNLAALVLYCAAGVILGAAGRHVWMAIPFLLVPILIVAPQGPGWAGSREAFAAAWERAVGGTYLLAGLPAALAMVGAVTGQLRVLRWVPVRPSAIPLLLLSAGLLMASLIIGSLLPGEMGDLRTLCWRIALLSFVLGWVALAYQIGRVAFVWEAALACLLFVAGALFLDRATQFPEAFGPTLLLTLATSLVPAALAAVGLLARRWIGTERPATPKATAQLKTWDEAQKGSFYTAAVTAPYEPTAKPKPQSAAAQAYPMQAQAADVDGDAEDDAEEDADEGVKAQGAPDEAPLEPADGDTGKPRSPPGS